MLELWAPCEDVGLLTVHMTPEHSQGGRERSRGKGSEKQRGTDSQSGPGAGLGDTAGHILLTLPLDHCVRGFSELLHFAGSGLVRRGGGARSVWCLPALQMPSCLRRAESGKEEAGLCFWFSAGTTRERGCLSALDASCVRGSAWAPTP